jgi:hypothetical protein
MLHHVAGVMGQGCGGIEDDRRKLSLHQLMGRLKQCSFYLHLLIGDKGRAILTLYTLCMR